MESILVLKRKDVLNIISPKGILKYPLSVVLKKIKKYGFYEERDFVEENPNLKQVIPYLLLKKGKNIFAYKRMEGGGEKRLHNLISIGVGGHMRKMSEDVKENLFLNLKRELEEEMVMDCKYKMRFLGILNEDFTPVCQVHMGLVFEIIPEDIEKVYVREERELKGGWILKEELGKLYEDMEVWSKILWKYLEGRK